MEDFGGKVRRKKTTRRPRRMWVDNNNMDLRGIEWDGMLWTNLAPDRD
jgi:hypothetical protein